jgi:glycosyltransferase involved in cell wall biosynthesis
MNQSPVLTIIIPAFNEEGAIGDVILGLKELALPPTEIIVVDDGSTDNTARVAQAAGARVISHPYNIGNGAAIKTGIRASQGRALLFMDGDGQHEPSDVPKIVSQLAQYHMVVGARSKESQASFLRDIANRIYNGFAAYVAQFDIKDLTSGMRAMRREDALRFCDLLPNTFSYPTTSTLAFIRSGRTVKYVPINAKRRIGKSKIQPLVDGPRFLLIIMKIATLFSPMRVFLPVSLMSFILGIGWYIFTYLEYGRFTNMSALLCNTSVIIFMLGLIAEQITSLRLEKSDNLSSKEVAQSYDVFSGLEKSQDNQSN